MVHVGKRRAIRRKLGRPALLPEEDPYGGINIEGINFFFLIFKVTFFVLIDIGI